MASQAYNSLTNQGDLMVPVKAAAQYAAHESSLFLGGALMPSIQAPNGLVRLPKYGTLAGTQVEELAGTTDGSGTERTDDIDNSLVVAEGVDIVTKLFAARAVVRDHGNLDPNEVGNFLGNAVSAKFDAACVAELTHADITQNVDIDTNDVTMDNIFDAVQQIRANGEMGQLMGIVSTDVATELMKDIQTTSYAGGDYQTEALRNGFVTRIAGVNVFQSSYMTANNATIFAPAAFRIAMQANLDVAIAPRIAAVGVDCVASLHAAPKLVDAARAVRIYNAA